MKDVDSANGQVWDLRVEQIRLDGPRVRAAIDKELALDYSQLYEAGVEMPLPIVGLLEGEYYLVSGFHRYTAQCLNSATTIKCEVRELDKRGMFKLAVADNRHGRPLSRPDQRNAIITVLMDEDWSSWSDGQIACEFGFPRRTVSRIRNELTPGQGDRVYIHPKSGKPTVMKTDAIGGSQKKVEESPQPDNVVDFPYISAEEFEDPGKPRFQINEIGLTITDGLDSILLGFDDCRDLYDFLLDHAETLTIAAS